MQFLQAVDTDSLQQMIKKVIFHKKRADK